MSRTLALGRPSAPTAIRWDNEPGPEGVQNRECCRLQETEECRALGSIKATIFLYAKDNALIVSDLIDLLAEEWNERYRGWWAVSASRQMLQAWFFYGLMHSEPGTFTLGRMSRSGEFIEIDGGLLATVFNLDAYRGPR